MGGGAALMGDGPRLLPTPCILKFLLFPHPNSQAMFSSPFMISSQVPKDVKYHQWTHLNFW
ncbi:hypothetical protein HanIR_Chr16g0821591 [Helianthus annuus]|nr:hypothetical protein HanIR_Chr16g0821591 [Helianthus annuus]